MCLQFQGILGPGGSREAEPTQSSDLLQFAFVQAGRVPIPVISPAQAVNGPPHLFSFTSPCKPSLPHSPAHTNTTSTCPQTHTTWLTGQPPQGSFLQARTCLHTHLTVLNKHGAWRQRGRQEGWYFPGGHQNLRLSGFRERGCLSLPICLSSIYLEEIDLL